MGGIAKAIGGWVLNALVTMINLLIAAVGGFINAVVSLLPDMPGSGGQTFGGSWMGWLNYYVPVAELVAGLVVWVGIWGAFLLIRIPLRWAKAL